jgi:predicted TIM-barrel fold metal-dependent hydrolase
MIRWHGADRVLFGPDWPWALQGPEVRLAEDLPLDLPQVEAILRDNAAKFLGA